MNEQTRIRLDIIAARFGRRADARVDRSIDFAATPAGERERMTRFFAREDERRGWQAVSELWLSQSPSELTRFEEPGKTTLEVAEQLPVDAVEQVFASAASGRASRE